MKKLNSLIKPFLGVILPLVYLVPVLIFYSCSSSSVMDDPEMYKGQVDGWIRRADENPYDADALKHLSVFYIQTHRNELAQKYINKAIKLSPDDPEVIFYKGLNLEFFNEQNEALEYYKKYSGMLKDSPYKELMQGRYLWIKRQQAYSDVDSLVKREKTLSINLSDSTMAVFPLIYEGINKDYVPLSRGFSEMVSIDLAKVKALRILERIRIQAVLDELKFGQSSVVDQSTAPRIGKLLGAGTIVSGDYDVTNTGDFKIDLGSWGVKDSQRKSWVNKTGNLKDFFTLQKEIVFAFLERNGIELTQAEKETIAQVPTQNLQSFLAYSKGLMAEDAGNFGNAATYFQRASELDPHFNAASEKQQSTQSMGKSSGSKEQLVSNLREEDPAIKGEEINLVQNRSEVIDNNVLSNFSGDEFNRTPAQDKQNIITPLPDPPAPPPTK
jgi:tetratricopeptide (TPR) repeat protein